MLSTFFGKYKCYFTISGQTWLLTILNLIQNAETLEAEGDIPPINFQDKMPFIEIHFPDGETGAEKFAKIEGGQRIAKSHLPFQLWKENVEKHPDLKIIQTLRNPKDSIVSFYHHYTADETMGAFNGSFNDFFELYRKKLLGFGDFFEHIAAWYKFNKDRKNSLMVVYEELKKDPKSNIIKIANFLNKDLSEKAVEMIVERSSIESIKSKMNKRRRRNTSWRADRSSFIRKGAVGGWREYFSVEQSDYVDRQSEKYLTPLGIKFSYTLAKI